MKKPISLITTLLIGISAIAQNNADAQAEINSIKSNTDYIYAQGTSMTSFEEADANARDILVLEIQNWLKQQDKKDLDGYVTKAKEHSSIIKTQRGNLFRVLAYVSKNDIIPYSSGETVMVISKDVPAPEVVPVSTPENRQSESQTQSLASVQSSATAQSTVQASTSTQVSTSDQVSTAAQTSTSASVSSTAQSSNPPASQSIEKKEATSAGFASVDHRSSIQPSASTSGSPKRSSVQSQANVAVHVVSEREQELLDIKTHAEMISYVQSNIEKGVISAYGKHATFPRGEDCYAFIYNPEGKIPACLKFKDGKCVNLLNGKEDEFTNYKKCGAFWIQFAE